MTEQIRSLSFILPPLPEQRRIVGILDETFEGIATAKANAEKNLQNARALFESHLQSVFTERGEGWEEKPLADLCDIKHGFAFKSEFFTDGGDYVLLAATATAAKNRNTTQARFPTASCFPRVICSSR
jgi:type I restriction enzyme S subunit